MAKIRERLAALLHSLGIQKPLLARARRRMKANHVRAEHAEKQKLAARETADRLRGEGHLRRARRKDRKALRLEVVETRNRQRAIFWKGRVKVLVQRVKGIETDVATVEAELRQWKKEHGVSIDTRRNKVTGGTARQRIRAAALHSAARCAAGKRANFYSQPGAFTTDECFTGESPGERSDCSQWIASVYAACGLEIPGTWTGDMVNRGKQIRRDQLKPGDLVIYGSGSGFHVELYVGPGDRTIGHGSAPIDPGVVDLLGDGNYRCFTYLKD